MAGSGCLSPPRAPACVFYVFILRVLLVCVHLHLPREAKNSKLPNNWRIIELVSDKVSANIRAQELNSAVAERLNKGLMTARSPCCYHGADAVAADHQVELVAHCTVRKAQADTRPCLKRVNHLGGRANHVCKTQQHTPAPPPHTHPSRVRTGGACPFCEISIPMWRRSP
eukprot:729619-Prorocentrum_minimum.AAC.1